MGKLPISQSEIDYIIFLRQTGHSLPEIRLKTGKGNSTVFKYIQGVSVLPEFVDVLRMKQGGSRKRSDMAWSQARIEAKQILGPGLSDKEHLLLLAGLYWGEGNKREFNVMNSDPMLIKTVMGCLRRIGVKKKDLKVNLRLYSDIDGRAAISFWSDVLEISAKDIGRIEIIQGRKKGKLRYGMCRLRVAKAGRYFKLVMSLINEIKLKFHAPVVQWIE